MTPEQVKAIRALYHYLLDREPWLTDADLADAAELDETTGDTEDRAALEYLASLTNYQDVEEAEHQPPEPRKEPTP